MFEPIGGSAPKYTGMNIINPLAAIACGGMMLEHLGEAKAAQPLKMQLWISQANKIKDLGAEEWDIPQLKSVILWLRECKQIQIPIYYTSVGGLMLLIFSRGQRPIRSSGRATPKMMDQNGKQA